MAHPFLPILVLLIFASCFAGFFLLLSSLIGPKKPSAVKQSPYECGINPIGGARERVSVKFFLVAILFILFDIEVVFLFPWAVLFRSAVVAGNGLFYLTEMFVFMVVLILGLAYVWRKKALEWR